MTTPLFALLLFTHFASAQVALESVQLQQLVTKSQMQVDTLKQMLEYKKVDTASLDRAVGILNSLTKDVEKSISKYQGTETYNKAMIELQSKDDFAATYSDSQNIRAQAPHDSNVDTKAADKEFKGLVKFQKQSVQANQADQDQQEKLQEALNSAGEGFVPKIQAQVELGTWKANTRASAQMTELLSSVQAMREELRILRAKDQGSNFMAAMIKGSEAENRLQKGAKISAQ